MGFQVQQGVGAACTRDVMSPSAYFLAAELAELILPVSSGFGLSLPLRELNDRV